MSREERKLRKALEERAKRERRLANKHLGKLRNQRTDRTPTSVGLVVECGLGFCDVVDGANRIRCRWSEDAAIGDRVLYSPARRSIQEILPRSTALSRSDPHNPHLERVIAANIDVVVNVVSIKCPPLRPGLIDRYLIAIGKSGAEALVCVNKVDLAESTADFDPLRAYEESGVPVVRCSAATGEGLDLLAAALPGKLCVFAGHSGVGKSSLLNALDPSLGLATQSVSESNAKGRHTTTSSSLHRLPNGATVIDTPGIREFGLWSVTAPEVRHYYHEFDGHPCAFSDCSHTHEPDCGVKAAVAAGQIPQARYEGYLRIFSEIKKSGTVHSTTISPRDDLS